MTRTQIGWAIAALGLALCFALDAYLTQTTSLGEYNGGVLLEPVLDGWAATPFLVLAALVLGRRLSLVAGVGGFLLVSVWTGLIDWATWTSDSSTAVLGLVFGPFYALIAVLLLWGGDALVSGLRRRSPSEWPTRLRETFIPSAAERGEK